MCTTLQRGFSASAELLVITSVADTAQTLLLDNTEQSEAEQPWLYCLTARWLRTACSPVSSARLRGMARLLLTEQQRVVLLVAAAAADDDAYSSSSKHR